MSEHVEIELVIDSNSTLKDLGHGVLVGDFSGGAVFRNGLKVQGLFLHEHACSIDKVYDARRQHDKISRRYAFISPLNHYPIISFFAHTGVFLSQDAPGLLHDNRFYLPNCGFNGVYKELPEGLVDHELKRLNFKGAPYSGEGQMDRLFTAPVVRLLEPQVRRALDYGLLPPNSIFSVMKIGHDDVGIALRDAGHNVIFEHDELLATWRDLQHAFLTWQILNGLLRGCRFLGVGGAANLFTMVPLECIYLYEFSDRLSSRSIELKSKWQHAVFGTHPIFDTYERTEMIAEANAAGRAPHGDLWHGYKPLRRPSDIVEKAAEPPGRPSFKHLPVELGKHLS